MKLHYYYIPPRVAWQVRWDLPPRVAPPTSVGPRARGTQGTTAVMKTGPVTEGAGMVHVAHSPCAVLGAGRTRATRRRRASIPTIISREVAHCVKIHLHLPCISLPFMTM
jgi:hypothetical protein